jgi:hypothetical protein
MTVDRLLPWLDSDGVGCEDGDARYTRVPAGSPPIRCANHTGTIAMTVRAAATTLMTGA